jgi:hypothetical protein
LDPMKFSFDSCRKLRKCMQCGVVDVHLLFVCDAKLAACLCSGCALSAIIYFGWDMISEEDLEVFLVHND